jgi:hypothetical protein
VQKTEITLFSSDNLNTVSQILLTCQEILREVYVNPIVAIIFLREPDITILGKKEI